MDLRLCGVIISVSQKLFSKVISFTLIAALIPSQPFPALVTSPAVMSLSDACCGAALLPHSTYGEWFNLNRLHFPLRAPSTRVLALLRREAVGRQLEVATPRQGAAPGCCTTARVYRRDPAAPRTDVCQEEAGRETSFLFYSNCHPAPVTATAKCFQLPHEMAQCNLLPSPPPRHRDELRQVPSLPPSLLLSRGVGAPACHPCHGPPAPAPHGFSSSPAPLAEGAAASCVRSCPARCPVPGAQHRGPEHPEHGLGSR